MRDTIDMAREVGCAVPSIDGKSWCVSPSIEKLVSLVRADEREAILHLALLHAAPWHFQEAIRARGNT